MALPGWLATKRAFSAGLAIGLVSGLVFGLLNRPGDADAARNGSGTYSLPSGNPVTAGTTIAASWANTTMSDIGTEITNSLDRAGRGAMTAPLQLSSGTSSAPGLCFSSESNSGIYRAGAGDIRMVVGATRIQSWAATSSTFSDNVIVTAAGTDESGITTTATGTGDGIRGTGGSTSGAGVAGTGGAPNGHGLYGVGDGSGAGCRGHGGDNVGPGVQGIGGATNGVGVAGTGNGTGEGGYFANGTAATGGTRQDAIRLTNGDINLDDVAYPTSTTSVKDRITPANFPKAWAYVDVDALDGSMAVTINAGFNVTSAARVSASSFSIDVAQDFASATYATIGICSDGTYLSLDTGSTAGTAVFDLFSDLGAGAYNIEAGTARRFCSIVMYGTQ